MKMSETFSVGNVVIEKTSDNKQVYIKSPKRSKPVDIKTDNLEWFAKAFIDAIQKNFPGTVKEEEKNVVVKDFVSFLTAKAEPALEIPLETEAEKTMPKPVMKAVEVPLTKFGEKEKKEKVEKEKEKAIDLNKLVIRFQELHRQGLSHDVIYDMLVKETGVDKETIVRLLPVPEEAVSKERIAQPKAETVTETTPSSVATPVAVQVEEKEFDITKLPGYQFLRPQHIEWLKILASKVYNCSVESLVKRLVAESKKFKINSDTVWITLLFNEARSHNLIQLVKERVRHLIFAVKKNDSWQTINCLASRNIEKELNISLNINRCYKLPEFDVVGRLIAMSIPPYRDINSYPKEYQKMKITKLEPTGDLPAIPYAHEIIKPLSLKQAIESVKDAVNKEIEDAVYGTIMQINEWANGNGAFLVIHDGDMDVPLYSNKILLSYDNPFGIDEKTVSGIIDKLVLVYGYIQYVEPKGNFPEGLTIRPMYLQVVS